MLGREFSCCREVTNGSAKMTFDGSIERLTCKKQHDDYVVMTNRTVLRQIGHGVPHVRCTLGAEYHRARCWVQIKQAPITQCLTIVTYLFLADMQAGFAFLEAGSVRSKNTTNILIKNVLDICKYYQKYRVLLVITANRQIFI